MLLVGQPQVDPLRRPQAGLRPKIVPVVMIVRPQVFGTESGRQQPGVQRVGSSAATRLRSIQPTALSIASGSSSLSGAAGQLRVTIDDPQHLPVGIPLAFLRAKVSVAQLPLGEMFDRPPARSVSPIARSALSIKQASRNQKRR